MNMNDIMKAEVKQIQSAQLPIFAQQFKLNRESFEAIVACPH